MKIIKKIFIVIGIIFLVLFLLLGILIISKPYGIDIIKMIPVMINENPKSSYDHPYSNQQQEAILESAGIDIESIPTQITTQQQECAISILGAERINEIISGSTPSIVEILKIKNCFE